jgi:choline-glycine betaine transporter
MADSERQRDEEIKKTLRDKCHHISFGSGIFRFNLNPVVSIMSAILIWVFVILCLTETETVSEEMTVWMKWVTKTWSWLYIGTQDVWAFFIIYLYFSKYSQIKLGKDDEKPEFGDAAYFTMLFAAGIGTGMFFYGVAEPIYHYAPKGEYGNRYQGRYGYSMTPLVIKYLESLTEYRHN